MSEFILEPGLRLTIPGGTLVVHDSVHKDGPYAETPKIYRLGHRRKMFWFLENDGKHESGFALFAEAGLTAGDQVEVIWVDPTCACVKKATPKKSITSPSAMVVLSLGAPFQIPEGPLVTVPSKSRDFPATPVVYLLMNRRGGKFSFCTADGVTPRGLAVFAPSGLKAGDWVTPEWIDPKCACLRRATTDEILDASAGGNA